VVLDKNILAIGAHPDDIEFGCLGTLYRLASNNRIATFIMSGKGTSRAAETNRALRGIGVVETRVEAFPDGSIPFNQETVQEVEHFIHLHNIDTILTQTRWDTHQDHRTVEKVVMAATRRTPTTILGYHSLSSTPDFPTNMIVNVEDQLDRKLEALWHHKSQTHKPYFDKDFLRQWHIEKAATAVGIKYAELFHVYQNFHL